LLPPLAAAVPAGFRVLELHNAHGYLLHEFSFGRSSIAAPIDRRHFENRIRLSLEVVTARSA